MIIQDPTLEKIIEVVMDPDPGFSTIIFLRNLPGRPTPGAVKRIDRSKRVLGDETEPGKTYIVIELDGMGLINAERVSYILEWSKKVRTVIVFVGDSRADELLIKEVSK